MARGIALPDPGDFTITVNEQEFSSLVADILGDEITDGDGWDKQIADLAAMFDGGDDLLSAMADHLPDAEFTEGDVDTNLLSPVATSTAQLVSDGDPLFAAVVDKSEPPGPPPPPAPDGDGGGGGDGDGGGGGGGGPQDAPCAIWGYDAKGHLVLVNLC